MGFEPEAAAYSPVYTVERLINNWTYGSLCYGSLCYICTLAGTESPGRGWRGGDGGGWGEREHTLSHTVTTRTILHYDEQPRDTVSHSNVLLVKEGEMWRQGDKSTVKITIYRGEM